MEITSLSFINSRLSTRLWLEFKEKHGSERQLSDLKRVKVQPDTAAAYAR